MRKRSFGYESFMVKEGNKQKDSNYGEINRRIVIKKEINRRKYFQVGSYFCDITRFSTSLLHSNKII